MAPWTLVESNDKNYARVKILQTVCERLENELGNERKQKVVGKSIAGEFTYRENDSSAKKSPRKKGKK